MTDPHTDLCQTCGDPVTRVYGVWSHTSASRTNWSGTLAELSRCADGSKLIPPTQQGETR